MLTILILTLGLMVCQAKVSEAGPMGTAFTYQGRLIDANSAADGLYDFQFKLYDDPNVAVGNQVGSDVNVPAVDVIDGYFTVELDFGSDVFAGDARWLEIGVRPGEPNGPNVYGDLNGPNVYTILEPRQELTPTPYAVYAQTAGAAHSGITGTGTANRIAKFTDSNTIGNSAIYENEQGRIGIRGAPHWKLGSGPDLHINAGTEFVDLWLGDANSTNGAELGRLSFVGRTSGMVVPVPYAAITGKITGGGKGGLLFYTLSPGQIGSALEEKMRILHNGDVGIGTDAPHATLDVNGVINTSSVYQIDEDTVLSTPGYNTFVGVGPGANNSTGSLNTFLGYYAGNSNTEGSSNTFVGRMAGVNNATGDNNTFIGDEASEGNTTGSRNTYVGKGAGWASNGSGNVFIGYRAGGFETGSNKLYIANGSADDDVLIYGDFSTGTVGMGTNAPIGGGLNVHTDSGKGNITVTGPSTTATQLFLTTNSDDLDPDDWYTWKGWVLRANGDKNSNQPDQFMLSYRNGVGGGGADAITAAEDSGNINVEINGKVKIKDFYTGDGEDYNVQVRWPEGDLVRVTSSQRYKKDITDLHVEPEAVCQLRSVRFRWKESGGADIGLIAEEVDQVISDLVIYDEEGRPDAVKYDKVALYLLEVVKELKAENESLKQRLEALETIMQQHLFARAKEVQQ